MIRKIYRTFRKVFWILCVFFLYIYFNLSTLTTNSKEFKTLPNEFPPLKYNYIRDDLNLTSVFNNISIKGVSIVGTKYPVSMYYRLLNDYTGICRKLARFGGDAQCRYRNNTKFYFDGHKAICVESEMRILNSLKTKDCFVLSFGTLTEISFEIRARQANCEVHLFDLHNFGPLLELNDTYMTFHQIGLGDENTATFYNNKNYTVYFNTFDYILYKLNATSRLINILKIDIEGWEWRALDYMLKESLLAQVGQIAVEVHDLHENNTNVSESTYRNKLRILLKLEEAGFRRVQYHDNEVCTSITDEFGIKHCHAGELLLANMNWYDADYMKSLEESLEYARVKFVEKF